MGDSREHMDANEVLKELSESFETILYVDFDRNEVYPYRLSFSLKNRFGDLLSKIPTYGTFIGQYINDFVLDIDKEQMKKICSKAYIESQLKTRRAFSYEYRVLKGKHETYYRIKFSNMDGPGVLHHCVIGIINFNSDMNVRREHKITGEKLLLVEDNELNMKLLCSFLQDKYDVLKAVNGNEALKILRNRYEEIGLVITDLLMPECDGFELIASMQKNRELQDIPVIVTTSYDDNENKIKCLELGAADFISKPYNKRILEKHINTMLKLRDTTRKLANIEIDSLTGLYTKEAFLEYAQNILDSNPDKDYIVMISDIVGFKSINEKYGKEMGDQVIKYLAQTGPGNKAGFIIGGRITADVFVCIKPADEISDDEERAIIDNVIKNAPVPNLVIKYGKYNTRDGKDLTVLQMCDRAMMALQSIKNTYGRVVCRYDDSMRKKLLLRQRIIDDMEVALSEEQFQVYFQPKQDVKKNQFAGAEALTRWVHPELGFMSPADFIPIFEGNGFITKLDRYVWKKACEEIAEMMHNNIICPISVNISRKDFDDPELADYLTGLTTQFGIPNELLHLEITESCYSESPEIIEDTIKKLHDKGFIIELDDFGSGYSSITALNNMNVDVVKIDMSIIRSDVQRTDRSMLEFTMKLAGMMDIVTVQEGVETEEQLNRVKSLGCDYVQGYYFSKPLPKYEFDEYARQIFN